MKLGIITDIHNNLTALEAVLAALEAEGADRIVCCGDMIGIGPYPEETVRRVMGIPSLIAVRGNHERYLLEGMSDASSEGMGQSEYEHHLWEHARLSEDSAEFLRSLPYRADFTADGKKFTVLHYCMDENHRYVNYTRSPTDEDLQGMFAEYDSDIILYGHDHDRCIREYKGKHYINVGSLGCPAGTRNMAGAGVVEISGGGITVKPMDIGYNADNVVAEIDRLGYPAADEIKMIFYGIG